MEGKEFKKLTTKEFAFCEAILRGLTNVEAAREARVPEKYCPSFANRALSRANVAKYIEDRRLERIEKNKVTEDYITNGFKSIFNRCMQQVPVMEFDRELKMMVQETDEEGNGVYTFDSTGAVRAMENMAKHIGYYEKDNDQKRPVINVAIITPNNIYEDEGADTSGEYSDRSIPTVLPPSTEE